MKVLYVPSDRQGAGKTSFCATLALRLASEGRKVGLFKPFTIAPEQSAEDEDARLYQRLLGQVDGGWPTQISLEGLSNGELIEQAARTCRDVFQDRDVVIVEGLPGLSLQASADLAEALDAQVVAIAGYRADLKAEEFYGAGHLFGRRLAGVVLNGLTTYMGTQARSELLPGLERQGIRVLGELPEDRRLLGVTVGELAQHLEGRFLLWEEGADNLVEHLMIGGLVLDSGTAYFEQRENKAVVVRGDRPDIQMAALNTPTSCLVLTGGKEPIEYVLYEAEQVEVPILLVQGDTHSTAQALEGLDSRARFGHPLKLERFQRLIEDHLDTAAIYSSLDLN